MVDLPDSPCDSNLIIMIIRFLRGSELSTHQIDYHKNHVKLRKSGQQKPCKLLIKQQPNLVFHFNHQCLIILTLIDSTFFGVFMILLKPDLLIRGWRSWNQPLVSSYKQIHFYSIILIWMGFNHIKLLKTPVLPDYLRFAEKICGTWALNAWLIGPGRATHARSQSKSAV